MALVLGNQGLDGGQLQHLMAPRMWIIPGQSLTAAAAAGGGGGRASWWAQAAGVYSGGDRVGRRASGPREVGAAAV
jgi:hypothetical protein